MSIKFKRKATVQVQLSETPTVPPLPTGWVSHCLLLLFRLSRLPSLSRCLIVRIHISLAPVPYHNCSFSVALIVRFVRSARYELQFHLFFFFFCSGYVLSFFFFFSVCSYEINIFYSQQYYLGMQGSRIFGISSSRMIRYQR